MRNGERGLSLVEATIILMVLATLTAVVAPSAGSYIETARNAKAKEDVETIGSAIDQLLRDTAMACLSKAPTNALAVAATSPCSLTNRVELLMSGSSISANKPAVLLGTQFTAPASTASATNLNWAGAAVNEVSDATKDLMDRHLVTNAVGYSSPTFTGGGGPRHGVGWRGAYVVGTFDVDPWGYAYQANTVFLTTATNAADGTTTGQRRGGWVSDVVVVSAGSNGTVQTNFGSTGTGGMTTTGDDVVYVLQGGTH